MIFASNGSHCETRYLYHGERLKLNNKEVKELLRHREALEFLKTRRHEAFTIDKESIKNRGDLITLFDEINNILRGEGLRAGLDPFNEFANVLFLKLLSEEKSKPFKYPLKKFDDVIDLLRGPFNSSIKKEVCVKSGFKELKQLFLPILPLEEQTKIVGELEVEEKLIEGSKQLIKAMGKKIEDKINALWRSH